MPSTRPVALITGASSGIGKYIALAMAVKGWRIIGTGRDKDRIASTQEALDRVAPETQSELLTVNLSLLSDAAALADAVQQRTDRLDVLVNNAGGMTDRLELTSEGLEANFAVNHLGPFLLTHRLLPLMRATARNHTPSIPRILFTSSDASEMLPALDLDDLQGIAGFDPGKAYCTGKLANVLFARELADRLTDEAICVHAVHPGAVDTNFYAYVPEGTRQRTKDLPKRSGPDGADTLVWLATTDAGAHNSGSYWYERATRPPNPLVDDPEVRARFWEESERLIASVSGNK